ncbi:hypothetical protein PUR29_22860 [Methylobacterium ajmalii]|uniref:Uncharacterized protein n=1 Tax=Methylobacterium ajmalii TaxID=2738439 RepID=A0ABU9ZXV8_9HYPH
MPMQHPDLQRCLLTHHPGLLPQKETSLRPGSGFSRRLGQFHIGGYSPVCIVTTSRLLPAKTRSFIAFASRHFAEQLAPRGITLDDAELAALYDLQEA